MNTVKAGGPLQRPVLIAAAAVALASVACLLLVLGLYAMNVPPAPALIAVGLYGLPVAFVLLMVLLVMRFVARGRS